MLKGQWLWRVSHSLYCMHPIRIGTDFYLSPFSYWNTWSEGIQTNHSSNISSCWQTIEGALWHNTVHYYVLKYIVILLQKAKGGKAKKGNGISTPFRRIEGDIEVDPRLVDNSFEAKVREIGVSQFNSSTYEHALMCMLPHTHTHRLGPEVHGERRQTKI